MTLVKKIVVTSLLMLAACGRMNQAKQEGLVIVNVLDPEYYQDAHIKGSINVPFTDVQEYATQHWDKEKTHLVMYCANYQCAASEESARMLQEMGYQHVWAYEGGTAQWIQQGRAYEGPAQQEYLQIELEEPSQELQKSPHLVITAEELQEKIENFSIK